MSIQSRRLFYSFIFGILSMSTAVHAQQQAPPLVFGSDIGVHLFGNGYVDLGGQNFSYSCSAAANVSGSYYSATVTPSASSAQFTSKVFFTTGPFYDAIGTTGVSVYVRGPIGTKYHLDWNWNVQATESLASGPDYARACAGAAYSNDPYSNTVCVYGAGSSDSQAGSGGTPIDGTSTGPQIVCSGQTYSLASSVSGTRMAQINYGQGLAQASFNGTLSGYLVRPNQQPPVAKIAPPVPAGPIPGTPVTLDGSGSYDPDGTIIEYKWTIQRPGGTDLLSGPVVQYTWNQAGTYGVSLTVTDNEGQTGTASTTVTVGTNQCNLPPLAGGVTSLSADPQCSCSQPTGVGAVSPLRNPGNPTYDGFVFELEILPGNCDFVGKGRITEVVSVTNNDCPGNARIPPRQGDFFRGTYRNTYADFIAYRAGLASASCSTTAKQSIFWQANGSSTFVDLTASGLNTITENVAITPSSSTITVCINGTCAPPVPYHKR